MFERRFEGLNLDSDNFIDYAISNYKDRSLRDLGDFDEDIRRVQYILALLNRYLKDPKDFKERLVLNHIIIMQNAFGVAPTVNILKFRMGDRLGKILNSFFYYLKYINCSVDEMDLDVLNKLKGL